MANFSFQERLSNGFLRLGQLLAKYSASNQFIEGAFAPVGIETLAKTDELKVIGKIPEGIDGLYARIGPDPVNVPNPGIHHWFAGDGMVHGLRIKDGQALWYKNRWVGTDDVQTHLNKPALPGNRRGISRIVNTNIIGHANKLWALVEAGAAPVEMDADLESIKHGLFNSDESLAFTAHPHADPATGDLHSICYDAANPKQIHYVVIDAQGDLIRKVKIPVAHGPMIHDCAVTASQVMIFDLPITFSLRSVIKGTTFPYVWNNQHQARIGLLSRNGEAKDVRWFDVDPCYVFHSCNAFDREDGAVVVDVVVYKRMFDQSTQGPEAQATTFERWVLPKDGKTVERQVLSDKMQEFPRFDERKATQAYRYAYTMGQDLDNPDVSAPIYKYDLETGQQWQYLYGPNHVSSEAVFVPRHDESAEDDGWLFSYVYDTKAHKSSVVILNAADITAGPQAVIELPVRVPHGFHGNWINL